MAIFKKEKKEGGENTAKGSSSFALLRPRFTEKATLQTDNNVYTFVVTKSATKNQIRSHIIEKFGKTPVQIRTSILPSKKRRRGVKPEVKKAFVYLKKGETIEFV